MSSKHAFEGFPKATLTFYRDLAKNNSKLWFDEHKDDFEQHVMAPARDLVLALGEGLRKFAPGIQADPRVNKSLFRINRDVRFSRDKTPYKTHLALWFWEGSRPRMECSGFYFHLEPKRFMLGAGIYIFPKDLLEAWREAVIHPKYGPALVKALAKVSSQDSFAVGGRHYKKTPRGYDPQHKNADLLLYNALYVGTESVPPPEVHQDKLVDYCLERFKKTLPVHQWLREMIERV
jgi:uncharacterized protein (TIGR02453 family)